MPNHQYPSHNFLTALENASQKLRRIGQGKEIGKDYDRIKRALIAYAHSPNEEMIFDSQADIRRVLSVLIQEVSSENDVLQLLIEKSKLNSLFKNISKQLENEHKNIIAKRMLYLYYGRYFNFEYLPEKEGFYFYQLLTHLINNFDGKSIVVLKAKQNKEILSGNLDKIIQKYGELKAISQELSLLESFEIYKRIQIVFLLERVKEWKANQWDKGVENILEQILEYKNVVVGQRNLLEETAFLVLQKCKSVNNIIKNWENFLIKYIGDPRIVRYKNKWLRVSKEYYEWIKCRLSRILARKFLTSMTDGQGDEIYQYRRQFWLQYVDHIQFSKIMINPTGIRFIERNHQDIIEDFQLNPEIHSKLNDVNRSCILMDFGLFCVIEGTHNTKLRFYGEPPINLSQRRYDYNEFHMGKAGDLLLQDFTHHNSYDYTWQNQARRYISDNFNINVKLEDIILEEDKHRLTTIKEHLFNRGQSIS